MQPTPLRLDNRYNALVSGTVPEFHPFPSLNPPLPHLTVGAGKEIILSWLGNLRTRVFLSTIITLLNISPFILWFRPEVESGLIVFQVVITVGH